MVECKYADGEAVFVAIYEKFAIEMCMTLTLTFRMDQCQI